MGLLYLILHFLILQMLIKTTNILSNALKDPVTGEYVQDKWFPLPISLWKSKTDNTIKFGVAVSIDGYPSL